MDRFSLKRTHTKKSFFVCSFVFRSDLVLLVPEVIQSDGLHGAVVAELATKHLLQHVHQVHMVLSAHGVVVVEV